MCRDGGFAPRRWLAGLLVVAVACCGALFVSSAKADWVWSVGYLWNASAPFSISVESHANATLTQWLAESASAWSQSGVVKVSVGSSGKITLYDGYYGTGQPCAWTQYWQNGGHIGHDAIYLNETCMAGWTDYWKQYAICQELGHALGMPDHNTTPTVPSCMAPSMPATTPASDDFAELALLYGTGASTTSTRGKGSGGKGSTPLANETSTTTSSTTTTTATTPDLGNAGNGTDRSGRSADRGQGGGRSHQGA
jgi:hypothetical protein